MRFNPNAKLDPSQVVGLLGPHGAMAKHNYRKMMNLFPFLTMQQRAGLYQMAARYGLKLGPYGASSIEGWFGQRRKPKRGRV